MEVDAGRMRLVLRNLVSNAIHYADPDKDQRWVRITARCWDSGTCHLWVADNGVGIDESKRSRIFERFYSDGGDGRNGAGLGLMIAREAARQMGARIQVDSKVGVGSTFSVELPPE